MRKRYVGAASVVAMLLTATTLLTAQTRVPGSRRVPSQPVKRGQVVSSPVLDEAGAFMPLRGTSGIAIFGIVQNHLGQLIPSAGTVILRELLTERIVAQTTVNELAQFSFKGLPGGLYSVELVGQSGAVLASSAAFTAGAGEVIQIAQTIPVLPLDGVAKAVSSATSSAMATAASSGVLAVADAPPLSPSS